jgi:hypothetical protein
MAGDPDPRLYLSNHEPTPRAQRPKDQAILAAATHAGWPKDEDVLTDMLSVLLAESSGDPRCFLAYIDLGADRHSKEGLARRKLIDMYDKNSKGETLTTYRHGIQDITQHKAKVVRADVGLLQLGRTFPGWRREKLNENLTVAQLMNPGANLKEAFRIWQDRGFRPWAAYTTPRQPGELPPAEAFHDRAWEAVHQYLG